MRKFLKKVLRNKKKILFLIGFLFLAITIPLTGYFVTSERSFDERSQATTSGTLCTTQQEGQRRCSSENPKIVLECQDVGSYARQWRKVEECNIRCGEGLTLGQAQCHDYCSYNGKTVKFGDSVCVNSTKYASCLSTGKMKEINCGIQQVCQNGKCVVVTTKYSRTSNACGPNSKYSCAQNANGTFTSLTSCEGSCTPPSDDKDSPCKAKGGDCKEGRPTPGVSCAVGGSAGTVVAGLCNSSTSQSYRCCVPTTLTPVDPSPPVKPAPPSGGSCTDKGGECSWRFIIEGSSCTTSDKKKGTVKEGLCPNADDGCCVPNQATPPPTPPTTPPTTPPPTTPPSTPPTTPTPGQCTTITDCRRQAPYEICFKNVCLRGDVLNNGTVSMADFTQFKRDFVSFKESGWNEILRRSDFNVDDRISMADYSTFVRSYRLINGLE